MAFRKCLLAFAVVAMILAAVPASAQVTCSAIGDLPAVRAEGLTESIGNITINCVSGAASTPTQPAGAFTLTLNLTTNITNRILNTTTGATTAELVDNAGTPVVLANGVWNSAQPTQLTFTVPAASITANATTMKIRNVVVDATKLAGGTGASALVQSYIVVTPGTSAQMTGGVATPYVATVVTTLKAVTVGDSANANKPYTWSAQQCAGQNGKLVSGKGTTGSNAADGINAIVNIGENLPWGFKAAGAAPPGTAGIVVVTFANIPSGVTVFVPGVIGATTAPTAADTLLATLYPSASSTGVVSGDAGTLGNVYSLTATSGAATAVYQITATDTTATETFLVPVYFQYAAGASATTIGGGAMTVNAGYGPISTVNTASSTAPGTRFVATANAAVNILNVTKCTCNVLFPFVSSASPFDTGLAISNTSSDSFSSAAQTGDVTFNFYGTGAPAKKVFSGVAAGQQAVFSMSNVAANWTGYVIAQADFQYCYGFAMIMPVGAVGNVASGSYLGINLNKGDTRGQ